MQHSYSQDSSVVNLSEHLSDSLVMNDTSSAPLPPTVTDGSGDPEGQFYVEPFPAGAVGRVYVVWRGTEPGIYWTWPEADVRTKGYSQASQQMFGTPEQGWIAYEQQRKCNFVQKLPYRPPGWRLKAPTLPYPRTESRAISPIKQAATDSTSSRPVPPPRMSVPPPRTPRTPRTPRATRGPSTPTAVTQTISTPSSITRTTPHTPQSPSRNHSSTVIATPRNRVPNTPSSQPAVHVPLTHSSLQQLQDTLPAPSARDTRRSIGESIPSTADSEHVGYLFETIEDMPPRRPGRCEEDPWGGEAAAFVVFKGTHPGIYHTWDQCWNATRCSIGGVFRGYDDWNTALNCYNRARDEKRLVKLPTVVLRNHYYE